MHSCTRALVHLHPYALSTPPPRPLPTQEAYSAPTQRKDLDPGSGEWLLVAARKKGSDSLLLAACAKPETPPATDAPAAPMINLADLVFAVDSVPAIFAITTDTFIVYTSNRKIIHLMQK